METPTLDTPSHKPKRLNYWFFRRMYDATARWLFTIGGIAVITSIALIGLFLFYMVFPLFTSASITKEESYQTSQASSVVFYGVDDYQDTAYAFDADGNFVVFSARSGADLAPTTPFTQQQKVTSHSVAVRNQHMHGFGLANGTFIVGQADFTLSYPNGVRQVDTTLSMPFGADPIDLRLSPQPIESIAIGADASQLVVLSWQPDSGLVVHNFSVKSNLITGEQNLSLNRSTPFAGFSEQPIWMGVDQLLSTAYVVTTTQLFAYALDNTSPQVAQVVTFPQELGQATTASALLGNISLLVGFETGAIAQMSNVPEAQGGNAPAIIRTFPAMNGSVVSLAPEYIRRGFAAADNAGNIGLYFSTTGSRVGRFALQQPIQTLEMTPRHDGILARLDDGSMQLFAVDNKHPEVSFASLWFKVWYEFYPEPDYVWQSTSGSNEFEPKLSLTPLVFGTLKAAFYAMLLAIPLAIMAAIYTAFFLSNSLRQTIKPVIELMEALPTVILGFLAGLWLAPYIEKNLTFLFTFVVLLPPVTIAFGFGMHYLKNKRTFLPSMVQHLVSEEWRVLTLIPFVVLVVALTQVMQHPLENILFGGSLAHYISSDLGIGYDQRNAIIIGIALGFAVIPSIFSIAEDAIYAVPSHLVSGSLALGASRWQTLVGVILPSASPGIFSGIMIGFGRAVGETMIVLMATGNTPIMDWNIFEGLRTLSANIAVEMPESEVGSSHYRILFLSALILFIFTFTINTITEMVRQNLRKKYAV